MTVKTVYRAAFEAALKKHSLIVDLRKNSNGDYISPVASATFVMFMEGAAYRGEEMELILKGNLVTT